jgi:hypothetical protein
VFSIPEISERGRCAPPWLPEPVSSPVAKPQRVRPCQMRRQVRRKYHESFIAGLPPGLLLGAWAMRRHRSKVPFPKLFWGAWMVVAIAFHGLSIASFRCVYEGLAADVSTLA